MKFWRKDNDTAVLKFYGFISTWWNGADDFTNTLNEVKSEGYKNLIIQMHCYGGEVIEGSAIFNAVAQSSLNVTWQIDGIAASMASIVMLAKGKIRMCENAFVMIHVPSASTVGNANDHFATGKLLKSMQQNFSKAYAKRTGKSESDVEAWFDGADHWFGSKECLDMKLVDEIISPVDEDVPLMKPNATTPVESVFARYTAISSENIFSEHKKQQMEKQAIVKKFNLSVSADSSDTAVLDALAASIAQKDDRIAALENEQREALALQAAAMINQRATVLNATFTEDQQAGFKKVAESAGLATLQTMLDAIKPAPVLKSLVTENGKPADTEDRTTWSLATWNEKDPEGLERLTDPEKEKIYASYKQKN